MVDSYKSLPEKLRLFSDCCISISLFVTIKRPSENRCFPFSDGLSSNFIFRFLYTMR